MSHPNLGKCEAPWHHGDTASRQSHPWKCPLCGEEARRIGMVHPSGAIIIGMTDDVILAVFDPDRAQRYVTWAWNGLSLDTTQWGHYSDSFVEAVKDYVDRCAAALERKLAERRSWYDSRPGGADDSLTQEQLSEMAFRDRVEGELDPERHEEKSDEL